MPKLTESELLDPNLSNDSIREIFYRGEWNELKHLRKNPKMRDVHEEVWTEISVDYQINYKPWIPILIIFGVMLLNLWLKIYPQLFSALLSFFCIFYISYIIPFINEIRESARIRYLDRILTGTPYQKIEENQENS